ncbi:MAG: Rne/Rng family ribonuclease [Deltaproteobacteria bacterium]|nr:Rne/Rng family ribonuclease [Deltaproteobacteria bacterium]
MTKRMLINAVHKEECRIAIVEDNQLLEYEVERGDSDQLRGNVYKAQITRIEPSLQAAFLDIGAERNGFLQINDINPSYFRNWPPENPHAGKNGRAIIQEVLQANQELVVQVVKEGRDTKGATLTTNISLPGRYLVLMIGSQRGGVSRKIIDEGQRSRLRQAVEKLRFPAGMGVIVRTAGINKTYGELQRDLDRLLDMWFEIVQTSFDASCPHLLYEESNLAIRTIRDFLTSDIEEILIDDFKTHEDVQRFIQQTMPENKSRVIYYNKPQPLFGSFDLDRQIDTINLPEVILQSGGSIVINITEAIVAIDVNSGRSTSQADVEETAFNTNKEASREIARQLRLRDIGGLIVIDFIDMWDRKHRQLVEKCLRDALRNDKAKIEVGRISKFGLLEMSRQRLKASLISQSHVACPQCKGRGRVRSAEATALEVLRKIQSAVFAGGISTVRVRMAPAPGLYLLNHKRAILSHIEQHTGAEVLVYADGRLKSEEYELELDRKKQGDFGSSYDSANLRPSSPSSAPSDSSNQDAQRRKGDRNYNNRRNRNKKYKTEEHRTTDSEQPTDNRRSQNKRRRRRKQKPNDRPIAEKTLNAQSDSLPETESRPPSSESSISNKETPPELDL